MTHRTYTVNVPADLDAELTGLMARLNTTADDVVRMAISLLLLAERGQLRVKMADNTTRQVTLERIKGKASENT